MRIVLHIIAICLAILIGVKAIENLFFTPTVTYASLIWPNTPRVQFKEICTSQWNDSNYEYEFSSEGQMLLACNYHIPQAVKTGISQKVAYFSQAAELKIYNPQGKLPGKWTGVRADSLTTEHWWKQYLKAGGDEWVFGEYVYESEYEDQYDDFTFSIDGFKAKGNLWIITVGTQGVARADNRGHDIPLYLYFSSTNAGKSWKLYGPARSDPDKPGARHYAIFGE